MGIVSWFYFCLYTKNLLNFVVDICFFFQWPMYRDFPLLYVGTILQANRFGRLWRELQDYGDLMTFSQSVKIRKSLKMSVYTQAGDIFYTRSREKKWSCLPREFEAFHYRNGYFVQIATKEALNFLLLRLVIPLVSIKMKRCLNSFRKCNKYRVIDSSHKRILYIIQRRERLS